MLQCPAKRTAGPARPLEVEQSAKVSSQAQAPHAAADANALWLFDVRFFFERFCIRVEQLCSRSSPGADYQGCKAAAVHQGLTIKATCFNSIVIVECGRWDLLAADLWLTER